jgi:SAM-dependent methyltransferase
MTESSFTFVPVERCMLCGSIKQHPVKGTSWKGTAFSYSLCARCGLKFMSPQPTPESMVRFFREEYWQANLSAQGFPTVNTYDDKNVNQMQLRMPKYKRAYQLVSKDLAGVMALSSSTRVLEVGCAFGYTLEWLNRDYGCQVFGIEPSTEAIKRCGECPAIRLVAGAAEEYFVGARGVAAADRYDVIFFRQTLETLLEPRTVLEGVREYLKDTGLLLVYSPNVEYYDLMSPFTPFVYSPETMSRLLAVTGFEVFRLDAPPSPKDRRTALRATPHYSLTAFARKTERRETVHPEVDPRTVARTIALGNARSAYNQLTTRELLLLLRTKLEGRIKKGKT